MAPRGGTQCLQIWHDLMCLTETVAERIQSDSSQSENNQWIFIQLFCSVPQRVCISIKWMIDLCDWIKSPLNATHFSSVSAVAFGNTISPDTTDVGADEGQKATLSCSYSSSGVTENLFWYRQYGRSNPEFLVATYSTAKETEVSGVDSRFSVKLTKKEKIHVILEISSAAVSDSALYYCALRPTVTGNTSTLYKNLCLFKG